MLASSVPSIPISYTVAFTPTSGGNWLTVSPGSGTTPGSETATISSSVLAGLPTGVYTGNVVFTATSNALNSPLSVPVTLTVTAALSASPSPLTFNFTIGGTAPGAQAVAVTSNAGAIAYTAMATSSGNWLSVTPGSATTPTGVSVSVTPGSLTAGQYTGSITLASAGASNSPVTIPVTFNVAAEPTLNLVWAGQPGPLTFNLTSLGSLPTAQSVAISASNNGAFPFTATESTASGGSWLSVTPSGTTPGSVTVSITLNNLAAGIYSGSVKITAAGTANSPVTVPIQLNVTAAPTLSASPASLSFAYTLLSGTNPASQPTSITATGGAAIPFTATPSTTSGGNWLTVTPSGPNTPATLTVSVNPTGLTAGVYSGSISLTSAQASSSPPIPVTFTVTAAPTLSASLNSLTYAFLIGGTNPSPQSFSVSSSGTPLSFTATAATTSGGNWLSVAPGTGTTPATLTASIVNPPATAGTYNGSITITSPGASNGSVTIQVTLTVSSQPSLTTSPSALTFNYTVGGAVPGSLPVSVGSTGTALTFTAAASTSSGGNWLSVTPGTGTTPTSLTVSVMNVSSLAPGTYSGTITITSAGAPNSPLLYPVTLIVASQPSLSVGPPSLAFGGLVGGANPASQSISVASTAGQPELYGLGYDYFRR